MQLLKNVQPFTSDQLKNIFFLRACNTIRFLYLTHIILDHPTSTKNVISSWKFNDKKNVRNEDISFKLRIRNEYYSAPT